VATSACVGENRGGKERLAKNRTLQPKWKPSNSISHIIQYDSTYKAFISSLVDRSLSYHDVCGLLAT